MFVKHLDSENVDWDRTVDTAIIGGGGCGLSAAVTASEPAHDVVVLEKSRRVGGKTRLSTGQIRAAGTRYQTELGVEDSADRLVEDILANLGKVRDIEREMIKAIADESGDTIEWLTEEIGIEFHLHVGPYEMEGNSVPRTHYPMDENSEVPRTGEPIIEGLRQAAANRGVEILTNTPAQQLIIEDGAVIGVVSKADPEPDPRRQPRLCIRAENVLIACDGFGANYDMRTRYFPETAELEHWGAHGNTGESVRWGEALGAQMETPHYNALPQFTEPDEVWLPIEIIKEGAVCLNSEGQRFLDVGNEAYFTISKQIVKQPGGIAYLIIDKRIREALRTATLTKNQFKKVLETGVFESGKTIGELADALNIDAENVEAAIETVNADAAGKSVSAHGRAVKETLSAPFYGTKIRPRLIKCKAGLLVDAKTRVINEDGKPMPNLSAGGNAAMSLTQGDNSVYTPGTNLMTALTQGKIFGRHAKVN